MHWLPQVLVEASLPDGTTHSVLLQNAETVKLVSEPTPSQHHSDNTITEPSSSRGEEAAHGDGQCCSSGGTGASKNQRQSSWRTLSVAALSPGDRVLLHRPVSAARHMGIAIQEFVLEQ